MTARGRDQSTTRAVSPLSRELRCSPRIRSVARTFIAAGSPTSISLSCVTASANPGTKSPDATGRSP